MAQAQGTTAPLTVLEPERGWLLINFRDLWRFRELAFFLCWRDVKVRYRQTVLGVLWVFIQSIARIVVFSIIFGKWGRMDSEGYPYPIFVCTAIVPWQFFASSLTRSSSSLVGSAGLITKVYFPRLIIPISSVGAGLVDLAMSFVVLAGLMIYYGIQPTPATLLVVPLVLCTVAAALGMGTFFGALNVAYRDFRYVVPFVASIWMFLTPVIYPVRFVPEQWRPVLALNPMTGIVDAWRAAVLGKPFDWYSLAISLGVTFVSLYIGLRFFRRLENQFADIV